MYCAYEYYTYKNNKKTTNRQVIKEIDLYKNTNNTIIVSRIN